MPHYTHICPVPISMREPVSMGYEGHLTPPGSVSNGAALPDTGQLGGAGGGSSFGLSCGLPGLSPEVCLPPRQYAHVMQ